MSPIERMLAEHDIARLVTRYAMLNDDGDFAGVAALYVADGRMARPSGGEAIVGRDAILASFVARPPRIARHIITSILPEIVSADDATCRSTMLLYAASAGELPATAKGAALLGGFRDRLVRTAEGWRFAERAGYVDMTIGDAA